MDALEKKIFKNKTLSHIFEEIYTNSKTKSSQINELILELKPLVETLQDATLLVPLIKDYLEIGIKNDEHLIKMAGIIQRLENSKGSSEDTLDKEIQALMDEYSAMNTQPSEENGV